VAITKHNGRKILQSGNCFTVFKIYPPGLLYLPSCLAIQDTTLNKSPAREAPMNISRIGCEHFVIAVIKARTSLSTCALSPDL
jgi:hypothetical protein